MKVSIPASLSTRSDYCSWFYRCLIAPLLISGLVASLIRVFFMERSAAELGPVIPLFALALAVISLLQATWPPPERKDMAVIFVLSLLFIVPSQQLTNVIIFFLAVWLLYRNSNQSFWGQAY